MYYIKAVSPKLEKSSGKILWYNLTVVNEWWTYNRNEFYSVEDMKSTFSCITEKDCLDLKWEEVEIERVIKLKKNRK